MTNIALTSHCNRSCATCFARAAFASEGAATLMSRETFTRALDFVDRSGVDEIRLLGGEPTSHPDFLALLELGLERDKRIRVFTNGTLGEDVLERLVALPVGRITLVVNLSAAEGRSSAERAELRRVLQRLGRRALVGVNLSRPVYRFFRPSDDPMDELLALIEACDLERVTRVGIAHPCVNFENDFARVSDYPGIGAVVLELATRAGQRGIALSLDCGFVPCMARELFGKNFGRGVDAVCGKCGPVLDIMPDGSIIPCLPLAGVERAWLTDDLDARTLRQRFEERLRGYRELGLMKRCATCPDRDAGSCSGGCLAAAMRRLRAPAFALRFPGDRGES